MILSRGRGYLFIHIPKTGGTALAQSLEARAMRDDILIGDTPKARARAGRRAAIQTRGRLWKHSTIADLDGLVSADEVANLVTFTIVRNPWDRLVSYYHWLKVQSFDHTAVQLAQSLSFADFLKHTHTGESLRAWPYGRYMQDATGREHCQIWVRFEAMAEGVAQVQARLNLRLPPLDRVNESLRPRDYRPFYSDDSAGRVAQLCAEDINRFGYTFE